MKLTDYIRQRGLIASHVSQQMGVSRQMLDNYCRNGFPTAKSLKKIAAAMTELGAPTTVVDLVAAIYAEEPPAENKGGV